MKKQRTILTIALVVIMLFSTTAYAATSIGQNNRGASIPTLTGNGGVASCRASAAFPGKSIDATLELYQGSTLVNSWHKTGSGYVTFSETENYTSGLSYTLTISGSAGGVDFPPQSVTKTLW